MELGFDQVNKSWFRQLTLLIEPDQAIVMLMDAGTEPGFILECNQECNYNCNWVLLTWSAWCWAGCRHASAARIPIRTLLINLLMQGPSGHPRTRRVGTSHRHIAGVGGGAWVARTTAGGGEVGGGGRGMVASGAEHAGIRLFLVQEWSWKNQVKKKR